MYLHRRFKPIGFFYKHNFNVSITMLTLTLVQTQLPPSEGTRQIQEPRADALGVPRTVTGNWASSMLTCHQHLEFSS